MKRSRSIWTPDAEEVLIGLWEQNLDQLRGSRKNNHTYQEMAADLQGQGYCIDSSAIKAKLDNLTAKFKRTKNSMGTTGASPSSWHLYEQVHRIIGGLTINNLERIVEESYEAPRSPSAIQSSPLPPSSSQLCILSPCPSTIPSSSPLPSPLPSSSPLPSPVPFPSSSPLPSPLPSSSPLPSPSPSLLGCSSKASADKSVKKKQIDRLIAVCEDMKSNFSEGLLKFTKSTEELVDLEKAKLETMQKMQQDTERLTDGVLQFLNRH